MVAITETTNMFGRGAQAVYREQGVTGWEWTTCNDPWVCPQCEDLDGQVFTADDEFEAAHPACRCWAKPYMLEEDEEEKEFNEEDHPRDEQGRFTYGGGGGTLHEDLITGQYAEDTEYEIWQDLEKGEREAVRKWVYGDYTYIQATLRNPDYAARGDMESRVSAIDGNTGVEIWEYVEEADHLSTAIEKAPGLPEETTVYRGLRGTRETFDKLQVGAEFTDKGFTSVSPIRDQAELFITQFHTGTGPGLQKMIVQIELPKGTKAYPCDGFANQGSPGYVSRVHEMILQKGFSGTIVKREKGEIEGTDGRMFPIHIITVRPK